MVERRGAQMLGGEVLVKTLRIRKYLFGKRCKGAHFDEGEDQGVAEQAAEGSSDEKQPETGLPRTQLSLVAMCNLGLSPHMSTA